MARERLAALRAQQQSNIREQPAPTVRDAGQARGEQYEMAEPHTPPAVPPPAGEGDSMSAFYAEISAIQDSVRTFNNNVSRISDLHSRSLSELDDAATGRITRQLDELVEDTRVLTDQLKARIKELQQQVGTGQAAQVRKQQTGVVRQKFVEAIQNYQRVEQQYRAKCRQRMERQFKVVKPDATPEEVAEVVNDGQAGQIFTQALQASPRYGESRTAYREVQVRHEDLQRIEKTLGELAQLFNDVSIIVEQQEETIEAIQTTAINVEREVETGLNHTRKALISARAARRMRWICFFIVLIILAVVAIVVGVTVPKK